MVILCPLFRHCVDVRCFDFHLIYFLCLKKQVSMQDDLWVLMSGEW
jgi:hypothetical protein